MNFRDFITESEKMRPFIDSMKDDLADIAIVPILADYLEEQDDPHLQQVADYLHQSYNYYLDKTHKPDILQNLQRIQQELTNSLREKNYYISPHNNEILNGDVVTYFWNGNNIRYKPHGQHMRTLAVKSITDPRRLLYWLVIRYNMLNLLEMV